MKTILTTTLKVAGLLFALAWMDGLSEARAAGDTKTVTGEGKCAKCLLKEGTTHQTVIQAEEGGKTVNYYVVDNATAKSVDKKFCDKPHKVSATGTVKEVNGKMELTPTDIHLVN